MASVQTIYPAPPPSNPAVADASASANASAATPPRIQPLNPPPARDEDTATTPTSVSFAEANGKRALPKSPPAPAHATIAAPGSAFDASRRPASQRSTKSGDSQQVDMKMEDEEEDSDHDMDGSVDGETGRPTKKKKGQRFFCTDYPPCTLSFTRSEHLARHIRKHTGERPFACHCGRTFSRLDNLRQHAQTVHVNEDIPGDSLAATGTRFQRQIRTDRVRPAGAARSRASTTSSQLSHGRGHGRNLSTSSIASTASNVSTISSISQDPRNYPQPLMMAPEHRHSGGLSIDTMRASPAFAYAQSSAGPTTPTSTHYSQPPASPYGSTMGSPISSARFAPSHFESRAGRRLSAPNGVNPFQHAPGPQFVGTMSPAGFSSSNPSAMPSPTASAFSNRIEPAHGEGELKRRTWHPSTYNAGYYQRPATSGLSYSQTPDAPRPAFPGQQPAAASQPVRLPGFTDLMQTIHRPATPPGQIAQAVTESPSRPPLMSAASASDRGAGAVDRPAHRSLDMSFYQNLNRLDIASGTPPRESAAWGQQVPSDASVPTPSAHSANPQFQARPVVVVPGQQPLAPAPPATTAAAPNPSQTQHHGAELEHPSTATSRNRRRGWYQGPIAPAPQVATTIHQQHRVSPASSSSEGVPTPSNPTFEHHPAIMQSNGFPDPASHPNAPPNAVYTPVAPKPDGPVMANQEYRPLTGLDALVAAATSHSEHRDAAQ